MFVLVRWLALLALTLVGVAAQSSEPRQGAILVSASQTAETDDVGSEDRREFPGFGHGASSYTIRTAE